ncbi:MAG: VC2046/SO_2500 family protein [Paraglaciecola sp.]|uniref:VC2046/SO_2500 family protein n=1 Tax=Paraglaciecola sp. TaxID=1920173 RepID=UPI003298989D
MLSSENTLDKGSAEFALSNDFEFNGDINRASQQGAKFSLLMAMLEPNSLHRPRFEDPESTLHPMGENSELYHYRSSPLEANQEYWQGCNNAGKLIETGYLASAQLWMAMHPEPLSQHNNCLSIDEDVLSNASVYSQSRMKNQTVADIKVDETGLFDILDELNPISA